MSRTILFPPKQSQASGWRSAIARWITRSRWEGPLTASSPEIARLFDDGAKNTSGVPVNESNALTYSAIWAAVTLISSQIASLPLILYKRLPNGGKERYAGHQVYRLLHDEPNSEMTSMVFRETLTAHALSWGNGYAEIEHDNAGRPSALWPLLPYQVCPYRDELQRLRYRVSTPNQPDVVLLPHEILHVPGLGFDGIVGYGVIRMAAESIGLGLAARRFGASFFGQGSTFGGILSHPNKLSQDAKDNLRASVEAMHRGPERAHRFLILQEGMNYTKLGVDPDSAQFLETRQFEIAEIARWFNIPPHKLRDLLRATFSNIEQQSIEFVTDTLRPWMVRWEQEINRKLISRPERNIQFVEHLVEGLLRGDIASRYAAYAVGRQWGWLSANDVRERENLNPLPGDEGDIYMVPMNMTTPAKMLAEPVPVADIPDVEDEGDETQGGERHEELVVELRSIQTRWQELSESIAAQDQRQQAYVVALEAERQAQADVIARMEEAQGGWRDALQAIHDSHAEAIRTLSTQLDVVGQTRERWEAERADLERQLAERQADLLRVTQEAAQRDAEARDAHAAAVADLAAHHAAAAGDASAERAAERTALEQQLAERQDALARVRAEQVEQSAAAAQAHDSALAELRAAHARALADVENALAAERAEFNAIRAALLEEQAQAVAAVRAEFNAERTAGIALAESRVALEATLAEQRAQSDEAATETEHRLAAIAVEVAERDARIAGLASDLERAESAQAAVLEATSADLKAQSDAWQSERERLASEHAAQIAEAEQRFQAVQADARRAQAEAEERVTALTEATETLEARAADVSREAADSLADLQAQLEAAAEELAATRAAADTARADAERLASEARAALEAESATAARAANAEREAQDAMAARAEAEARAQSLGHAEEARVAAVLSAHRALAVDTMRRMIEREADRARRAQATPQKLRAWLDTFYSAHESLCRTALLPVVRVHLAWMTADETPESVAADLARQHVERSVADIRAVLEEDPEDFTLTLNAKLHQWETERAQVVADWLFQKEIDYVRRRT